MVDAIILDPVALMIVCDKTASPIQVIGPSRAMCLALNMRDLTFTLHGSIVVVNVVVGTRTPKLSIVTYFIGI